jgi:hypothetical protein
MTQVLPNEGTKLSFEIATVMTAIPQVTSIDAPNPSVASIPTTHLTSTTHTKRPSRLLEPGQIGFTIEYDPDDTTHQALFTALGAKTVLSWKLEMVDDLATPANETFSGFITAVDGGGIEIETNHERTFTVEVTGSIIRTAGSAGGG